MSVLSADFGTSSVKLALVDRKLNLLKTTKRSYQYSIDRTDYVEINLEELLKAFFDGVREFGEDLQYVEAIAIDTFAPSPVFMDVEGRALYPLITHMDRRSRVEAQEICDTYDVRRFLAVTGTLPHAGGVTLTTLLWFMKNRPDIVMKTEKLGHLTTYLYKLLTGRWAIDPVNACITGMYDTVGGDGWSQEICSAFHVPSNLLPPIGQIGEEYGRLLDKMAEKLGVGKGIPVLLGTQDVAAAQIGAGNEKRGDVLLISGSSEMISILIDQPVVNEKYYLRKSATAGLWQIFSITIGGFAQDWFLREFCREMAGSEFFEKYVPQVIFGHQSLNKVEFEPYLSGDRQSMEKKTGSFRGMTLSTTREDLLYALIEGIQKQSVQTLKQCEKISPINTPLNATGNLLEIKCYHQMKQQLFEGKEIRVLDQCPLRGNAILAYKLLERL